MLRPEFTHSQLLAMLPKVIKATCAVHGEQIFELAGDREGPDMLLCVRRNDPPEPDTLPGLVSATLTYQGRTVRMEPSCHACHSGIMLEQMFDVMLNGQHGGDGGDVVNFREHGVCVESWLKGPDNGGL